MTEQPPTKKLGTWEIWMLLAFLLTIVVGLGFLYSSASRYRGRPFRSPTALDTKVEDYSP
jgi:hypothetical protein